MTKVIETSDLVKSFGATRALDGFDLSVEEGTVHGFLGPNGSGKSTAIRILLGMIRSDAGSAWVMGLDPWRDSRAIHRRVAYVPGDVNLWPNLTGGEVLDLLGGLRGGFDEGRRRELCELFELDLRGKGGSYSRGNRQKVALVAALSVDADLYVFDEPTAGLDPLKEVAFQQCVRQVRERGGTVLLSSHILAQVEQLADDLTIISKGRALESGSLSEMKRIARSRVEATVSSDPSGLDLMPGVHDVEIDGPRICCSVDQDRLDELLRWLLERNVTDLITRPPTLEDLFLSEYRSDADR
jgi:ABC-2 type transport system ATP-binding protein